MFKVGDKVEIRDNLIKGQYYGDCLYVDVMKDFVGKVMEIAETDGKDYMLKGIKYYWFSNEMLEPINKNNKKKIIITTNGGEIFFKIYKNDKMISEWEKITSIENATKFSENIMLAFKELKEVEYYNGKIVATKDSMGITKGRVYRVNQGQFKDDAGLCRPVCARIMSLEDLNEMFNDDFEHFIEIVE